MKVRLIALFLVFLTVVACNRRVETSQPTVTNTELMNQDSTPLNTAIAVSKDRSVLVERSEEVDSVSADNAFTEPVKSQGRNLIIVYVTIGNTGKEFGSIFGTQLQLIDNEGRRYDAVQDLEEAVTINMWLDKRGLEHSTAQIFPGGKVQTAKVFRVSPNAFELKLLVNETSLMDIN
ncbi:MAG: DUF4352 domain-containing protein [Leptolyngbya sp. SIO1D8]|nr:DUF4352 domain-containing protein [Leptolyngbya sp. SIO1D8]